MRLITLAFICFGIACLSGAAVIWGTAGSEADGSRLDSAPERHGGALRVPAVIRGQIRGGADGGMVNYERTDLDLADIAFITPDEEGRFEITGLPRCTIILSRHFGGCCSTMPIDVEVPAGGVVEIIVPNREDERSPMPVRGLYRVRFQRR